MIEKNYQQIQPIFFNKTKPSTFWYTLARSSEALQS